MLSVCILHSGESPETQIYDKVQWYWRNSLVALYSLLWLISFNIPSCPYCFSSYKHIKADKLEKMGKASTVIFWVFFLIPRTTGSYFAIWTLIFYFLKLRLPEFCTYAKAVQLLCLSASAPQKRSQANIKPSKDWNLLHHTSVKNSHRSNTEPLPWGFLVTNLLV